MTKRQRQRERDLDKSVMEGFWGGMAEGERLRKLHGPLCQSCLHDHEIADDVIKRRSNRLHDATCWMVSKWGRGNMPFCDKHRTELKKTGWKVTRRLPK